MATITLAAGVKVVGRLGPLRVRDGTSVARSDFLTSEDWFFEEGLYDLRLTLSNSDGTVTTSETRAISVFGGGSAPGDVPVADSLAGDNPLVGELIQTEGEPFGLRGSVRPGNVVRLVRFSEPFSADATETVIEEKQVPASGYTAGSWAFDTVLPRGRHIVYVDSRSGGSRYCSPAILVEVNRLNLQGTDVADLFGWRTAVDLDDFAEGAEVRMKSLSGHFPDGADAFDGALKLRVTEGTVPAVLASSARRYAVRDGYSYDSPQGVEATTVHNISDDLLVSRTTGLGTQDQLVRVVDSFENRGSVPKRVRASYGSSSVMRSGVGWAASFLPRPLRMEDTGVVRSSPNRAGYVVSCEAGSPGLSGATAGAQWLGAPGRPVEFVAWAGRAASAEITGRGGSLLEFDVTVPASGTVDLTFYAGFGETTSQAVSLAKRTIMPPHVRLKVSPGRLRRGTIVKVWGHICPSYPYTFGMIEERVSGRHYADLSQFVPVENGQFSFRKRMYRTTVFRVMCFDFSSGQWLWSNRMRVTVKRWPPRRR